MEEELQIFLAAGPEECNDFLIFLYSFDNLSGRQRAAAVLVDHFKAMPGRVEELARKFCNFLRRRLALRLARGGPLRQLVGQRGLDRVLPGWNIDR